MPQKYFLQSVVGVTTIGKKFQNDETRKLATQGTLSDAVEYLDIIWQNILMSDLHNLSEDKGK